jgi:hypothetical protein
MLHRDQRKATRQVRTGRSKSRPSVANLDEKSRKNSGKCKRSRATCVGKVNKKRPHCNPKRNPNRVRVPGKWNSIQKTRFLAPTHIWVIQKVSRCVAVERGQTFEHPRTRLSANILETHPCLAIAPIRQRPHKELEQLNRCIEMLLSNVPKLLTRLSSSILFPYIKPGTDRVVSCERNISSKYRASFDLSLIS